jgi:hypothetical protein
VESARPRTHPVAIFVALIFAVLVGTVAIGSIWANSQLLDTSSWVGVSDGLLKSHQVRHRVAVFLGEELVGETESQLRAAGEDEVAAEVLPRLRDEQVALAERVMQTPQFAKVWDKANEVGHRALVRVLDEEGTSRHGDAVDVDLTPALRQLAEAVGHSSLARELGVSNLGELVQPGAARIEVLEAEELNDAQDAVKIIRHLTLPAVIALLVLYGLVLLLGRRRLPRALLGVGVALAATGALALVARGIAGHQIVDRLLHRHADREAAEAAWHIATSTISHLAVGSIVLGAFVFGAALLWEVKPGWLRRRTA